MVSGKNRLGKGLNALIPDTTGDLNIREIPVASIKANPDQPRKSFNEEKLQELADSLREHGLIQPVLVSPELDGYVLIAGERRFRAAVLAKLEKIPAIVKELESEEKLKIALVENLQREDLNPLEEAMAYRFLMEEHGLTQEKIAQSVGKSRSAVANKLRLLSLPEEVREALSSGEINAGQARTLLGVKDDKVILKMARELKKNKKSVRDIEKEVSTISKSKKEVDSAENKNDKVYLQDIREKLQKHLGTKVSIANGRKMGIISIEYYGEDDLGRLIELIIGENGLD